MPHFYPDKHSMIDNVSNHTKECVCNVCVVVKIILSEKAKELSDAIDQETIEYFKGNKEL